MFTTKLYSTDVMDKNCSLIDSRNDINIDMLSESSCEPLHKKSRLQELQLNVIDMDHFQAIPISKQKVGLVIMTKLQESVCQPGEFSHLYVK